MPFPSALSSANLETLRGGYSAETFLALSPNTLKFQCNPSVAGNSTVNTQVTFSSTLDGDINDARVGMTVLITPTSDYVSDWNNDKANCLRTRVRKTPTSTILYIGPTGFQWDTSVTVTVLQDFQVHEKLYRLTPGGVYYKDWDVLYRAALPRISNLQSAYYVAAGDTLSLSPTVTAEADSATISSYTWDIDGNTFDSGDATSKDITVSFASTGRYWFYFTATDSNGNSNWFAFFVVVGIADADLNLQQRNLNISRSLDSGATASIDNWGDLSSVLDNTLCVVYRTGRYRDGSTAALVTPVDFIGYLQQDTPETRGSFDQGVRQTTRLTFEGIAAQIQRLSVPPLPLRIDSNPDAWGDFESITPWTAVWYLLSEHSTVANVSAQTPPADIADFLTGEFNTGQGSLLDVCKQALGSINAEAAFAASGEMQWERSAVYLTVDAKRNALTTVADFNWRDIQSFVLQRDAGRVVGQVESGSGMYHATTGRTTIFRSLAPTVREEGAEARQLNSQVLADTQTIAAARSEAGLRAANHRAAANPTPIAEVEFASGYSELVPHPAQWYTFTLATTDGNRGIAYTTAERWLCLDVTVMHDNARGTRTVSARFRLETQATRYALWSAAVPLTQSSPNPIIPPTLGQPWLPFDDSLYYPDDNILPGEYQPAYPYTDNSPVEDSDETDTGPPSVNCEDIIVPFNNPTPILTNFISQSGATYEVFVEGVAKIGADLCAPDGWFWVEKDWPWSFSTHGGSAVSDVFSQTNPGNGTLYAITFYRAGVPADGKSQFRPGDSSQGDSLYTTTPPLSGDGLGGTFYSLYENFVGGVQEGADAVEWEHARHGGSMRSDERQPNATWSVVWVHGVDQGWSRAGEIHTVRLLYKET